MRKGRLTGMIMEYRKRIKGVVFFLWMLALSAAMGCGGTQESVEASVVYPDYSGLLESETEPQIREVTDNAVIPARIYFDNTGSMTGFTINSNGWSKPESGYSNLIRCLRDLGRIQDAEYYVLGEEEWDWVRYEGSLYTDFAKRDFYIWWGGEGGPLSRLLEGDRLDGQCVNIVLTDLSEQGLNNTYLAEQLRKLCKNSGCEADMYAFWFEFHGNTQVPIPDAPTGMIDKRVDGPKPYYMLMAGPSEYMERYREELKELLAAVEMVEGEDYFTVTNRMELDHERWDASETVFEPFASFEEIKAQDADRQSAAVVSKGNGRDALSPREKSRNLAMYEESGKIFEGEGTSQALAFYYRKEEGLPKRLGDWSLGFYIPLSNGMDPAITYSCEWTEYVLSEAEDDGEQDPVEGAETEAEPRRWVRSGEARVELEQTVISDFEECGERYPIAFHFVCHDKPVEREHAPRPTEVLLVVRVEKEERHVYETPDWLAEFDTGTTDDYHTRTFNLIGFYDVLFGYKNKRQPDGTIRFVSTYAEIPIMITGLEE